MNNRKENQIALKLRETRKRRWQIGLLLCLSLLVTAGIAGLFHLPAIAKTYQVIELTCTAEPPVGEACADFFVHIHNDDCYDSYGNLVCPLPEIKPHRHTEECYTTTSVLVCGLPESDGHQHTADCYTSVRGDLICELSTEPVLDEAGNVLEAGHVHTDECYEWREELTCGMEEGQGAHHHDDSCYQTEQTLTCDKPEILLHTHTEDCYETDAEGNVRLVCGQMQVLEHVHGPACFTVYELDDGEPEESNAETGLMSDMDANTEPAASGEFVFMDEYYGDESGDETDESKTDTEDEAPETIDETEQTDGEPGEPDAEADTEPAVSGEFVFMDEYYGDESGDETDESKTDTEGEAPETIDETEQTDGEPGEPDADTDTEPAVSGEFVFMDEYYGDESGDETDESKTDTEGEAPETMDEPEQTGEEPDETAAELSDEGTEETAAEPSDEEPDETAEEPTDEEIDETAKEQADEGTAKDADQTDGKTGEDSPEEPLSVRMPAQNFEESTDTVMVRVAAPDGAFPPETTMRVTQIEIESVMDVVQESVGGEITRVQAVDISFFDADGNEIEPMVPIHVDMIPIDSAAADETEEAAAASDGSVQTILHVDNDGNATVVEQKEGENTENSTVSFAADSFSVYILVYSNTLEKTVLASDGETYRITLSYDADAGIPADAELAVEEILPDSEEYKTYLEMAENSVENEMVSFARFFDITILSGGEEIQPAAPVDVKIELADTLEEGAKAIHFGEEVEVIDAEVTSLPEKTPDAETAENAGSETAFSAEGFSVYGVIVTTLEKTITASDGNTYSVNVTYGADAKIPVDAVLSVEEILQEEEATDGATEYDEYIEKTREALGLETGAFGYARFFDIKITDADGGKVGIAAPVSVEISLADKSNIGSAANTQVVHFADGSETGDVVRGVEVVGETVSFEAESFSAYAIVEGPEAIPLGWHTVSSVEELIGMSQQGQGLYIGHTSGYYFGNSTVTDKDNRIGITKTKPAKSYPPAEAALYYFEKADDSGNKVYAYCYAADGTTKQYVYNNGDNSLSFTEEEHKTAFTVSVDSNGRFLLNNGGWYWNMQGNAAGTRFCSYNKKDDNNNYMYFWYYNNVTTDPYGLDNASYGLMNWNGGVAGKALMNSSTGNNLDAKSLTVMSTSNNTKQLFAPNDSDISMWKFQWTDNDYYYLTTVVDGSTKYLKIDGNGLSLVSEHDDACKVQVIPGSGTHAGEISLKSSGHTLTYSGDIDTGFSVGGSAGTEWLHLVELSELTNEYFMTYSASKVSVSDKEKVTNGSRVIVYTRSWNEAKKQYDFYAIGSDGTLVPVFENGDSIEWVSGQINQLLWNFVEYYWEGTEDPNYYYELYNQYSQKYIAPQVTGSQILSNNTIGINLNGRRDGKYYSTILAWDEPDYSYVGLKVEDDHIVTCPKNEAMDFYFAIMEDLNIDDHLHTVDTVDHTQYGITMKIIDLENAPNHNGNMSKVLGSNSGGTGTTLQQGLLSTNLDLNGYPTAVKTERLLSEMYSGAGLREVNHLFIESTYYSSGYFEYDSTQNYAYLEDDNNFKVYKELGSYDSAGEKNTLKHGQFFPFNDLQAGTFASVNEKNLYTFDETDYQKPLPDSDPRKHEQLYSLENSKNPKVDTYFAMELEASFTQTPSGLDAWGHDIIFEFTGDDDFWLYVDGELVIDLGGIHSSVPGSVNFRTGEVNVNGIHTTLKDLFYNNYLGRNNHTQEEAQAYVDSIFVINDDGQCVFKDYSPHTMKIFYMERGAGASNLHMRFNLAAVKKGTVQLSKELAGVDDPKSVKTEFPYQILYKLSDGEEHHLTNALPDNPTQNDNYVFYKDSVNPVKYLQSLEIDGHAYQDVFFLKAGETADINFPEGMTEYRIVECRINTNVYSKVTVNGSEINGTAVSGASVNRKDFGVDYAATENRTKVNYVNTVNPNALRTLTIKKKLFDEAGTQEISYVEDETYFTFRLSLASEYEELDVANMHSYHVKDPDGYYCRWNRLTQKFETILDDSGQGISDYSDLTEDQKNDSSVSFTTSIYGTIAKIPAGYTVEVRNVLAGTQYRVEERPEEIPDGYSFQKYEYNNRVAGGAREVTTSNRLGVNGTVVSKEDDKDEPYVNICNLKGWGLRVNKIWSDADYMSERDTTYFAVFTRKQNNGSEHGHGYGLWDYIDGDAIWNNDALLVLADVTCRWCPV